MEEKLLSIIVPVYNVEKHIEKCLRSLMCQTYTNIEIIVINDGSTDCSGIICDEIAKTDNRIRVIHTKNKGVSAARNLGISLVNGQYLTFVDADDFVEDDIYQKLIEDVYDYDTDIAMCNMCHKNQYFVKKEKGSIKIYTNIEMLERLYGKNYVLTIVVWNKIYKTELFKDIVFPEGLTREDEFVMHKVIYNSKKVSFRDEALYHYITHKGSITRQKDFGRINRLIAVEDRLHFFRSKGMHKLYYLSLLRLLNDSVRCFIYVYINCRNENVLFDIAKRFTRYYDEMSEMICYFNKNRIYSKLFFVKYCIIKMFHIYCLKSKIVEKVERKGENEKRNS